MDRPSDDPVDPYAASIEHVARAAVALNTAVHGVVNALEDAARERAAGVDLVAIIEHLKDDGGREARLAPTVAFRVFEQAVTDYRATAVRILVDENAMTFTAVGELIGVSRQMVARLYRAGTKAPLGVLT